MMEDRMRLLNFWDSSRRRFLHNEEWLQKEGAYALIQSSKPQSLAQGLNDSPAGLAAWLVEKFRAWSDCDGDIESRFTKDELFNPHHDLLGDRIYRLIVPHLLRLC
jgi:hypothetical protein